MVLAGRDSLVVLEVTNSGEPIPPGQVNHLFDRFYRADNATRSRVAGRGLGLALAREFARAHDGTLSLSRNEAGYISFRLELPQG